MEGTVSLAEVARRMEQAMFWSRWQKRRRLGDRRVCVVVLLLCVSLPGGSRTKAQSPSDTQLQTFTLEEAVAFALKNYPAVRASLERVRAAEAGVGVACTTEATFVVTIRNGSPEWVNVARGRRKARRGFRRRA